MTVTAHYITEEGTVWTLVMSVIAFIRLMKSHSGERLGQAFFQICKRVGIEQKVHRRLSWHVTSCYSFSDRPHHQ
jgi:hypothetical protein